ncbi:MAG TPA: ferric uptake regulator family protein [Thiolapillus brandeum]|uniref:Ferric uptake regulator family protein n=1 Tax=Thiolapillus brandeum TaxID=1076588 RepID=A0A7C5N903_9GAMM|nr:ferric uptake regulator family protein [Thiolapillus brandeum]
MKSAALSLFLVLVLPAWHACAQESSDTPWFTAPYSGEKVKEYEVTLPVSRYEEETFLIPRDCKKLNSRLLEGAGHWGNRVQRRLWIKADDDCRYLNYLKRNPKKADKDFVSSYDFLNARITDLPLRPGCDLYMLLRDPDACPAPPPGMPDFSMFMMHQGHHPDPQESRDECRFENGVFRGHIHYTPEGLRCYRDRRAPGYRILSVDFADVNADGYLDAVLRMTLIGSRSRPELLVLPLTRFSGEEPFTIPKGAGYPRMGPTDEGWLY